MEKVVVTVVGAQKDASGEENRIELVTAGRHYTKNGVNYITYEETELSGMEGTTTLLKIYPSHVVVVRMGSIEHKQEFRLGEKTYSTYVTPVGSMKMAMHTHKLNLSAQGINRVIQIGYELEIDGQWLSSNELSVTIREEQKHGY
ncbi:MAG: DUF1934 domain-containing protein [Negativicutes bacterium]|nr:DUF1934 domain-containing protein [Negativicutes bacterium]